MPNCSSLPQMTGRLFLTDGGLETDMIFNHGFELPAFASHTLLDSDVGRAALKTYFLNYLRVAQAHDAGFVLDCPTWRAQGAFAGELGVAETDLWRINRDAVRFAQSLRETVANSVPVVINGLVGPCGDAYMSTDSLSPAQAQDYHAQQVGWLADAGVDMISAMTFTDTDEAIGVVCAAQAVGVPSAVSFTVETDGRLPSGEALGSAIKRVDRATNSGPAYYMINCAHPEHFVDVLDDPLWLRRLRGLRCNASRKSHAELDACETLDDGDPAEFGALYADLVRRMPWINVLGGCCGSDLRHVAAVAQAITGSPEPSRLTA